MSKERYISKEEYKEYEIYKVAKKAGQIFTSEGLMTLARECGYDPERFGERILRILDGISVRDMDTSESDREMCGSDSDEKDTSAEEDFLPFIEYQK